MKFKDELIQATLSRRYKRFLADVQLENGEEVTAHCANPGAMDGLKDPGIVVWLSKSDNPKRKLKYSWELAEINSFGKTVLVGINTAHPNRLAMEAIEQNLVSELAGYDDCKKEVRYGQNSRIDILLTKNAGHRCYVEVKNVHLLRQQGLAEFPDSVTKRGAKHLDELSNMVADGHRAVMLYVIQREDVTLFSIAKDKDPFYGEAFERARNRVVEMIAYACEMSTKAIQLKHKIGFLDTHNI